MKDESIPRADIAASLATSQELGSEYNEAVAEAVAERLEHTVDKRVDAQLAQRWATNQSPNQSPKAQDERKANGLRFALAVVSLVIAVPLTGIVAGASSTAMAMGMLWAGIAAVNGVFYIATRR